MSSSNKIYPPASQEMAKMLGIESDGKTSAPQSAQVAFPGNLPILEAEAEVIPNVKVEDTEVIHHKSPEQAAAELDALEDQEAKTVNQDSALKIVKAVAPYIILFAIGIFLYYFFFSSFSFQSLLKNAPETPAVTKTTAYDELKTAQANNFRSWMRQFYFDVSDASILDPDADNSANGLTNFEEYLLGLNPKTYDTLHRGKPDGQYVVEGTDPATGRPFADKRLEIVQNYIDLEVISNRLTLRALDRNQSNDYYTPVPQVAPGIDFRGTDSNQDQSSGSINYYQDTNTQQQNNFTAPNTYAPQVQSYNQQQAAVTNTAPQTAASSGVKQAQASTVTTTSYSEDNRLNIDTTKAGLLEIPSLNVKTPVIWTTSVKNFDKDLKSGVVHYPGTALPGDTGLSYISGHSSNYSFVKSNYNYIFSKLGDLKDLASFTITVNLKNGKTAKLHYVVQGRGIFKPDDQTQFANTADSEVALSTCWPPGTSADRLVVFGKLTQVEQ